MLRALSKGRKKSRHKKKADEETPAYRLQQAIEQGDVEAVKKFLKDGSNATTSITSEKNPDGYTALHLAVLGGTEQMVDSILKFVSVETLNACDKKGRTCLHLAARCFDQDIVERLLQERGLIVNARTNKDDTVLHVLARYSPVVDEKLLQRIFQVMNCDSFRLSKVSYFFFIFL